jgi:hypothetical protein
MLSGRHFLLLGVIACAGLISVRDGQKQVDLCYQIGAIEKDLREVRSDIELCKIKHRALQSPLAVTTKAAELQLKVAPVPTGVVEMTESRTTQPSHSLGSAQGARRPPVPAVPAIPPRPVNY